MSATRGRTLEISKPLLSIAAALGFLVVLFGAFGSHLLKDRLSPDLFTVWEVGVRYQMYHALAILALVILGGQISHALFPWAAWAFALGTIIFSGSLYLMALTGIRMLGAITPIGGTLLLIGWLLFFIGVWKGQTQ